MTSPRASYAATRVRAMRGRLAGPELAPALLGERGLKSLGETLTDLGLPVSPPEATGAAAWRRHGDRVASLQRHYPHRGGVLASLVGLEEVANLQAVWRAVARGEPDGWAPAWRPLGGATTLWPEALAGISTLPDLVSAVSAGPWGDAATLAWRTHRADPEAAEFALEQAARRRVLEAAHGLGRADAPAARLLVDRVVELEVRTVHAAVRDHGLSPSAAATFTDALPRRLGPTRVAAFAGWRPGEPPPTRLPARLLPTGSRLPEPDTLARAWAERRRRACLAAFVTGGLGLGPAVALTLLLRAEAEALVAAAEAGGAPRVRPTVRQALTGAWLGAATC